MHALIFTSFPCINGINLLQYNDTSIAGYNRTMMQTMKKVKSTMGPTATHSQHHLFTITTSTETTATGKKRHAFT